MSDQDRGRGTEQARVAVKVVTGDPSAAVLTQLRDQRDFERFYVPGLAVPPPNRIQVVDGVKHVFLRDPRGEELEHFLEMAKRLQIPVELGQATVYKKQVLCPWTEDGSWPWENVLADPDEVWHGNPQSLTNGGVSTLWEQAIGNGTATAAQLLTYFNNGQAATGVGDSTTAFAATQNDLQAATNKLRKAMDATYPTHTDGTTSASQTITFQSTYATGDANWAWQEWIVANSATAATGRALNRKVEALGTKVSTATWILQVAITIA